MPAAADQSFIAAVTFSCGAIAAYSIAKWHENSRGAMREAKLRAEVELARREATLEASELRAEAEDEKRVATRLTAEAAAQTRVAEALHTESRREHDRLTQELQRLAGLNPDQARALTIETLRKEMTEEVRMLRHEMLDQSEQEVADEARRKLLSAMQRLTTQTTQDATSVLVYLPNEDMKGRIVGREGRNIRTFEQATGATLLIDDTPGQVLVSCFDPVRREIARIALERIVKDGRVTPTLIEETVRTAAEEVVKLARRLGRDAVRDLGLPPMHETVEELLGRLHFRLSANQNTLAHSIEVAQLCAMLAAEIGIDPIPAKRAGLLHDLGKAIEAEAGGSHALDGAALLRRLGEDPRVVNAVAAHHREVEAESLYAPLVMIADSASGSRPGARASTLESFVQRARGLEEIAQSFDGVREAFAFQAGRELRVIVDPGKVNDTAAAELARRIRLLVEEKLSYPGTVKIVLIREQRFAEEAR
ncbi:ribonuclease Y [Verrucomicrobiota bacterium]|nr:ribonuclease Y [Verrucomicrobiota bacterium]GDY16759.1 ribonuclease Y [Verrucomicrobiota bacterium]